MIKKIGCKVDCYKSDALGGEHSESWAGGRMVQWNVKHHLVGLTVNS
jgi:hypothetical protein